MPRDGSDNRVIGGAIDWRCGYPDLQHAIVPRRPGLRSPRVDTDADHQTSSTLDIGGHLSRRSAASGPSVTLQHSGGSCLRPGVDRVLSYSNASEKPWHSAALSGTQRH